MIGDRALILVRERSVLDILDLALEVIRTRPGPIAASALVGIAPCAIVDYWVSTLDPEAPAIWWLLLLIQAPWSTAVLTVVLGDLMFARKRRAREVVKTLARAIGPLLFYQFFLRTLLLATWLFGILIPLQLSFLNTVILLEPRHKERKQRRSFQAIRRSSTLSGDRGADLFALWISQIAFGALFLVCFRIAVGSLWNLILRGTLTTGIPDFDDEAVTMDFLSGPITQIGAWILVAFYGVTQFLTYIDQRIRLEGWAVELSLREVGRALEEDGRDRLDLPTVSRSR